MKTKLHNPSDLLHKEKTEQNGLHQKFSVKHTHTHSCLGSILETKSKSENHRYSSQPATCAGQMLE